MSWLVYRLTSSPFLLGLVGFVGQMPVFLFTTFAGVLADRVSRNRVLVITQTLSMAQALILASLVLTGTVRVWHIICLNIFLGFIDCIDIPTRQSFVVEMVEDKKDLGNAIALNSSMMTAAQLLGPSIAGLLIAAFGEGMCFFLNGVSYIGVIASLLAMKIRRREIEGRGEPVLKGLSEGVQYAFGFPPIRSIILLIALVSLMGVPYMTLMPIFARDVLSGGPHTLGFLMGSSGVGALIGATFLASRKTVLGLGKWIAGAAAILGLGLMAFSISRVFWCSLLLILCVGFGLTVQHSSGNTVVQTLVEDDKRGRVMSLYVMAFRGMTTFGSLLAGSLASKIGAPNTLMIGGASCLLGSLLFARKLAILRQMGRPVYERLGIVPKLD